MTSLELLICAVLIAFSAFLSASEIALFSLSRFQLRSLKESFRQVHRRIKKLLGDPGGLLITVLVLNEMANIGISALVAQAVAGARLPVPSILGGVPRWALDTLLGILITAPIVLILCEVTPKVVAARINKVIATLTVGPLSVIYALLKPLRFALRGFVAFVSERSASGEEKSAGEAILKESDFMLMVEEGHKEGAVQETELELIRNVFDLDDTTVASVTTPFGQVYLLIVHTTLKGALLAIRNQRFSRIPVTRGPRKEIVGILYAKDLLRAKLSSENESLTISTIMRKPLFVAPGLRLNALFRRFKQLKTHMAVVQAQGGEVMGIATMSDVLDALFEDLLPEDEEDSELEPASR